MTEKRFWEFNITGADDHTLYIGVKDSQTGKYYHTKDGENARELELLLNALHEENKKLRMSPRVESIELEGLICENQQLKQENEQLKKLNIPIDDVKEFVQDYKGRIIGVYYND